MKKNALLLRFSLVSLISLIIFGYAFGMLLGRSMEQSMFKKSAEETADIVVQNVVKHFKERKLRDPKTGKKYHKFSHDMDHLSLGKDIIKAKIWNRDFRIVWDEDKESVGQKAEDAYEHEVKDLKKAFSGTIVVEASNFRELEEKHHETAQEKRILEIYVPIRFETDGEVANVFEIYQNLDPLYETISHHKKVVWLWTIAGFSSLYVILFGGFWQASRRINRQTREISQAQQEWEETFNTITDMITIHDRDFNILRANKAAAENYGVSSLKEINTKCYKSFHNSEEPPEWCPGMKCLKSGKPATAHFFDPDANKFFDIRAIPRFNDRDELIGFIHDVRDITDAKKAEEEKEGLQNQLLQTQKMDSIGRLAGGVAHDFNNILSVIIGYSEMSLKEIPENSDLSDSIKTIFDAGERAAALTRQLLAFSRKQVLEMKAVDINTVCENMLKMLKRLIPANVKLEFHPQAGMQKVLADHTQLEQILLNLAVNARDAMPEGGSLVIKTSEDTFKEKQSRGNEMIAPGSYIILSVTDSGTGMSQEVQDRIFEPFFSTKGVGKGTGMGLSTVYGIVKQHKGHISVLSELNNGTTFAIYFPASDLQAEATADDMPDICMRGNETILVVDDEPLLLKVITKMIQPLGYNVLQASSGEDALQVSKVFGSEIDLLLTDVVMPGMNGKELADTLRSTRAQMQVIYMSGYTDDAIAHHGVMDKEVVLINKPVTEKVLAKKIREVLDNAQKTSATEKVAIDIAGLHILAADDNKDIRMIILSFLKNYDCKIEIAENGQIAIEKFKNGTYNLVLMDMQMPIMDGLSATKAIRKWENENNLEETPIIALTGNSAQEDIDNCLEAGCTTHLAKPMKRDDLINVLLSVMGKQKIDNTVDNKEYEEKLVARVDAELKELVPEYFEERYTDIKNIQEALETGDYETIRILGHSIKGSGGAFGFDPITEIGIDLENAAVDNDSKELRKLISQLEDYMENVQIIYEHVNINL